MFIVRAAIRYANGEILEGRDYGSIAYLGNRLGKNGEKIFGFTTESGDFVLPDEAAKIAFGAKQIESPVDELTAEDLWGVTFETAL